MRVSELRIKRFKRFTDLTISGLPELTRLVMLCGPNGSGKSSLFDAFRSWHYLNGESFGGFDEQYHRKAGAGAEGQAWQDSVRVSFHTPYPENPSARRRAFYIRSAYRHEPEFTMNQLQRTGPPVDGPKAARLIDTEVKVSDNYRRLVAATIEDVYGGQQDQQTVRDLRERLIGSVRESMSRLFEDLVLDGLGNPLDSGSFFFTKGDATNFHYKNLSGGEKAAFDLLLDLLVKRQAYDDTIFCVDEPELHMNTRLQARLLQEMVDLLPGNSQLWVASHSIGMMRKARDMEAASPSSVVFLDFQDRDYDQAVTMTPVKVDRDFWRKTLTVALDDLAGLVAPATVVLCEGSPATPGSSAKAEFDARCYRVIFGTDKPDVDFLSVGNANDVVNDRLAVGSAIQTLVAGTKVVRVIDRDDRNEQEIEDLRRMGVRVLSARHLEAYLLSDEMLEALCASVGQPEKLDEVRSAKEQSMEQCVANGRAPDDVKSASGLLYVELRRILSLTQRGNTPQAFMVGTVAPLVKPGTATYTQLEHDIFGT